MKTPKLTPENERALQGMRRAVQNVVEQAKKNDEELVIFRDGKVVWVKARDL